MIRSFGAQKDAPQPIGVRGIKPSAQIIGEAANQAMEARK
jgi:hypothetical protein